MERHDDETSRRRMRAIVALLAAALIVMIVALTLALHRSSAMREQIAGMERWRAGILAQLGEARRAAGRSAPVRPDDANEALSEIIASRDSAMMLLSNRTPSSPPQLPGASSDESLPANISTLSNRSSTGVASDDAAAIEKDSQMPWTDWK